MTSKLKNKSDFLKNVMTWKCTRNISVNYYSGKKKKDTEKRERNKNRQRVKSNSLTLFMAFFTDCPLTLLNSYGTHKQDVQPPKALGSIKTQMQPCKK